MSVKGKPTMRAAFYMNWARVLSASSMGYVLLVIVLAVYWRAAVAPALNTVWVLVILLAGMLMLVHFGYVLACKSADVKVDVWAPIIACLVLFGAFLSSCALLVLAERIYCLVTDIASLGTEAISSSHEISLINPFILCAALITVGPIIGTVLIWRSANGARHRILDVVAPFSIPLVILVTIPLELSLSSKEDPPMWFLSFVILFLTLLALYCTGIAEWMKARHGHASQGDTSTL